MFLYTVLQIMSESGGKKKKKKKRRGSCVKTRAQTQQATRSLTHVGHLVRLRAALPGQTSLSDQPLTTYSRLDFFFPGNASGVLGWRDVLCLWVTERGRRGALCSALLSSARLGAGRRRTVALQGAESRSAPSSLGLSRLTHDERDPRAMTELRSRSVSFSHPTSALVDFIFVFSEPPLDVRAHMCATRLTAAAASRSLTSTCFVGKY